MIKDSAKTIVCYGDSNTWGAVPLSDDRYPRNVRWTGVLQSLLGDDYEVINEGLCGRTFVGHDPVKPWRTGINHIQSIVETADPCYLTIIMLGTNDIKTTYGFEPNDIVLHLEQTINAIRDENLNLQIVPKILIICPAKPVEPTSGKIDERLIRWPEFLDFFAKAFKKVAEKQGCYYLNAGDIIISSKIDGYHLDPDAHAILAKKLSEIVKVII